MRLTSGASDGTRNYIVDGIRYVCANFKERAPVPIVSAKHSLF